MLKSTVFGKDLSKSFFAAVSPPIAIAPRHFPHTFTGRPPTTTTTVHDACDRSRAQKSTAHAGCSDNCDLELPIPVNVTAVDPDTDKTFTVVTQKKIPQKKGPLKPLQPQRPKSSVCTSIRAGRIFTSETLHGHPQIVDHNCSNREAQDQRTAATSQRICLSLVPEVCSHATLLNQHSVAIPQRGLEAYLKVDL